MRSAAIVRMLLLLVWLCPLTSYAECEELQENANFVEKPKGIDVDFEYAAAIRDYVKKFKRQYRSESFFAKLLAGIERIDALPKGDEQRQRKEEALVILSDFQHYDASIKTAFLKLAKKSYTPAFYCLGFIHEFGIGTEIDYAQAWAWFTTAVAVDGIKARAHQTRIWQQLSSNEEMQAKTLAIDYLKEYTDFQTTPSETVIH